MRHFGRCTVIAVMLMAGVRLMRAEQLTVKSARLGTAQAITSTILEYKDVFDVGETIYFQVVFTWDDYLDKKSGRHKIETKWLDGEKVVEKSKGVYIYRKGSEGYLTPWIKGVVIGPGKHAVELYVDGKEAARREFEVKEQGAASK
jgi:hypothetical protein